MRARVERGRLHLDEPCSLPEGTVLDLVLDDEGDDLDDGERQALHGRDFQRLDGRESRTFPSGAGDHRRTAPPVTATVVVPGRVEVQIGEIDRWWRKHRPAARGSFVEEPAACFALLASAPHAGRRYAP